MKSIKKILRKLIPRKIFELRHRFTLLQYRHRPVEEIFAKIYSENKWEGRKGEFFSGTGTNNSNTEKYITACVSFIKTNNITSILDIGCGDFTIMNKVIKQTGVQYVGADVARNVIENNCRHYQNEHVRFVHLNAIEDELPKADLVTIRQVLQHLSNEQISAIVGKAIKVSKYLLISEHLPIGDRIKINLDKHPGPDIRIHYNSGVFLEHPPFSFHILETILEYDEDFEVYGTPQKAVIRTSLIKGDL